MVAAVEDRPTQTTAPARSPVIVASYERVSTRMQGQYGFSLGHQHQSLEDFTRAQNWALPEHLRFRDGEDEDASGADWDLPDLNRMLAAARQREFQILVVPDFDRFARSLVKGLVLEEQLKKYGVRVVYQRVPVEDSAEGRLLKNQLYSFAEYEREKITLRTTMGRRRKAQVGQVVGNGSAPYGYRFTYALRNNQRYAYGLELDPLTAPIARRILRDLRTRSTLDVQAALNAEGIPGPTGGRWTSKAVHRIGTSPVYAGTWIFGKNGRRVTPDDGAGIRVPVPALIDRGEWDEIQRALAHRQTARRARIPREDDPYVLRSMLACGHCHGNLHGFNNRGTRYYGCPYHVPSSAARYGKPICSLPDVYAVGLEEELIRRLRETLLDAANLAAGLDAARSEHDRADGLRRDRLAAIDAEVGRLRTRLQAMVDELIDAGPESKEAIRRKMTEAETLIARLDGERAELAAVRSDGLSMSEADAIEAFAAEIRKGVDGATRSDLRDLYELLRVRGKVHFDEGGIRLGRKHSFRIEWTAAIQLLDSASRFKNAVIQWIPPPALISSPISTGTHSTPASSYNAMCFFAPAGNTTFPGASATPFSGSSRCPSSGSITSINRNPRLRNVCTTASGVRFGHTTARSRSSRLKHPSRCIAPYGSPTRTTSFTPISRSIHST